PAQHALRAQDNRHGRTGPIRVRGADPPRVRADVPRSTSGKDGASFVNPSATAMPIRFDLSTVLPALPVPPIKYRHARAGLCVLPDASSRSPLATLLQRAL